MLKARVLLPFPAYTSLKPRMLTPYQVGGSLHNNDPTYVVRSCDHQLYNALKSGEFCYIFNSRQMGKSSLLIRAKHQLEAEGYRCAIVDMTHIGSQETTALQWYKGIMIDLLRGFRCLEKLNFKAWWQQQEEQSLLLKFSQFIQELLLNLFPQDNLCIFIDEIDSILSLNFPLDDFFSFIRACYNQRAIHPEYKRLTFALCGVATPSNLIADKTRTPFNIGTAINLTGFTLEEATPLAEGLTGIFQHPKDILKEILTWTNGQPFLTQKLLRLSVLNINQFNCQADFYAHNSVFWIQNIVRTQIIEKWESHDEPEHFRTIQNRIFKHQECVPRLLIIYQQILQGSEVISDGSPEQVELLLSGLVIKNDGNLKVKNRIYQEIFNLSWVEEQLEKLRPYSQTFEAWLLSGQQDESRLLRGKALQDAQIWSQGKNLSSLDYQFIATSVELERKELQLTLETERAKAIKIQLADQHQRLLQQQKTTQLQRLLLGTISLGFLVACGLGLFAFQQYKEAKINEIKALASSSKGLFASDHQLDSMIDAIKAKRKLETLAKVDQKVTKEVEIALRQTVYYNNEFNRLIGHKGSVLSVDISPDNQFIATASNDKTVQLWKRDGTLLKTLKHTATVHRVAFSPDGRLIVSASLDGMLKIWQIDGTLVKIIQAHQTPIWGVTFSPDGQWIASASGDKTVKLWRVDGTLWKTLIGHQLAVWNVVFTPDSQMIASAGTDKTIKLWNLNGKLLKTLTGHQNAIWDLAFCASSNSLVSVSSDNTAKLWKTDGTLVRTLLGTHPMLGVDCHGQYIATSGTDNQVKIWKIDGTFIRNLKRHRAVIRDVAMSSDGLMVASASDDGTVKLWQRNQYLLKPLYRHQSTIWDLTTHADGTLIASVSADKQLNLWQTNGLLLQTLEFKEYSFRSVDFSPNRPILVAGTDQGNIEIWSLEKDNQSHLKLLKTLTGHRAAIYAVAIAPDGKTIVSGSDDNTIKIWNFEGKLLYTINAHQERIWKLAFSRDGQLLASASEDGTVKLWTPDGKLIKTLISHEGAVWGVAFSPQTNLLVSVSRDDTLSFWKTDGTLLKTIQTDSQGLTRVAFSPDGQTLATGGYDNTIKLWSLKGELLKTLPGHQGTVISLTFTADGKFLVSGGDDGTLILWDLKKIQTLNEIDDACDWVADYLQTNIEVKDSQYLLCL